MARPLSILIVDADRYFTYGLGLGLQAFFQARQQEIHLLEEAQIAGNIDIIFLGDLVTSSPWLYWLHQRNCHPMVFFIKDHGRSKGAFKSTIKCEKCNARALYRHHSLFALYDLLDNVLFSQPLPLLASYHFCSCMSPLTSREVDVLRCIYRGMNGRDTGAYLHISNKTANAHKQNAMRKLNFRCNQELYQWLLQGGGNYLNERSQAKMQPFPLQLKAPVKANLLTPAQLATQQQERAYSALPKRKQPVTLSRPEHIPT